MNELIAVAVITILAVVSPGPDFAMITRNSYSFGSKTGLMSALGIACGVQVHVIYTVFGIAIVIASTPSLFMIMKLLGVSYLIYLGYKSLTNKTIINLEESSITAPSLSKAFLTGFFTNALNPKTMLFVIATYTQVVSTNNSLLHNFGYGLFMSLTHWVWFSLVAIFFSNPSVRKRILERQQFADRLIGIILIMLGASLAFTNIH